MRHLGAAIQSKIDSVAGALAAKQAVSPKREARLRTRLRSGSVHSVFGQKLSDCLFVNISLHGARLRQLSELRMPPKLIVCDERLGIKFAAEVRWQRGNEIGIFIRDGVPSWMPYLNEDGGRTTLSGRPCPPDAPVPSGPLEDRRRDHRSAQ